MKEPLKDRLMKVCIYLCMVLFLLFLGITSYQATKCCLPSQRQKEILDAIMIYEQDLTKALQGTRKNIEHKVNVVQGGINRLEKRFNDHLFYGENNED